LYLCKKFTKQQHKITKKNRIDKMQAKTIIKLPKGIPGEIAAEVGCHVHTVYRALEGKHESKHTVKIRKRAMEILKKNKKNDY